LVAGLLIYSFFQVNIIHVMLVGFVRK
jgi:hypothetical protein